MRRPRISIAALMMLVALIALDWVVMSNGIALSKRVSRRNLTLCYSWSPERGSLPIDEPLYPDYVAILDSDHISASLAYLAVGTPPMLFLIGVASFTLLRNLVVRGCCSPFLLGFVSSGSAATILCAALCISRAALVERYAMAPVEFVFDMARQLIYGAFGNEIARAIGPLLAAIVLGLPPLIVALLGAKLNARILRVALVVLPRSGSAADAAVERNPR
jgi:hypothetical protein